MSLLRALLVAVGIAVSFLIGFSLGVDRTADELAPLLEIATSAWEETVSDINSCLVGWQATSDALNASTADVDTCLVGWQSALDDVIWDNDWHAQFAAVVAPYYDADIPIPEQVMADLVWCSLGRASPLRDCLAMLEE